MRPLGAPIGLGRWTRSAILVLACSATWVTAAAPPAPLRLVSTAWPPFTNAPRQPRFALDLVEDALGRINLTARTTIVSAPQFTPTLLSGLFDGSGAAWKDPERERALIFSQAYLENRLVLDRRNHQVAPAVTGGIGGSGEGQVVGLGSSRGEDDLLRQAAQDVRDLRSRRFQRGGGIGAGAVDARGVAEAFLEEREHRFQHLAPHGRGGGVVEVDRTH